MPAADENRLATGRLLLGARVRALRTDAGMQLAELAERAGLTKAYLSDVERGRKLPTLPTLDALAAGLDTSPAKLFRGIYPWGTDQPPSEPPTAPPDGRAGRRIRNRKPPTHA